MSYQDSEPAYAKINLALHVRRREPNGYHMIETLFAFAEDGDLLHGTLAGDLTLEIVGPFAAGLAGEADNLVLRAASALRDRYAPGKGAALRLEKNLPVSSGIGGGSADAAAALRLLKRLWRLPDDEPGFADIAAKLGADVPACLASLTARGEGRGDTLEPIPSGQLANMPLLLVNPGVAVSTAQVFGGWDRHDRGPLAAGEPVAAALAGRNDLEPPARRIAPEIDAVMDRLVRADGIVLARMSGSGATCFALFESLSARDAAHRAIAAAQPGWWCFKTKLRGQQPVS